MGGARDVSNMPALFTFLSFVFFTIVREFTVCLEVLTVDMPCKVRRCVVLGFTKFVVDYENEAI